MPPWRTLALVSSLLTAAPTPRAIAAPSASDALVLEGKRALEERRFEDAMKIFRRGLEGTPDEKDRWQMLLGLALAHELGGELVEAAAHYQAFLASSSEHPSAASGRWAERRRSALDDLARLEARILETRAVVSLVTNPAGAAVAIEGQRLEPERVTPAVLYLPPGQHTLEISLAEHIPMILAVSVEAGQRLTLQRPLLAAAEPPEPSAPEVVVSEPEPEPEPPATPPAPTPPGGADEVSPPHPWLTPVGIALASLGGVSLATGIGFTAASHDTAREIERLQAGPIDEASIVEDAALRNEIRRLEIGAAALYAAGGALVASGVVLLVLDALDSPRPLAALPLVSPTGAGVRVSF